MVFELLYLWKSLTIQLFLHTNIDEKGLGKKRDSIMMRRSPVARFVSPLGDPCQMYGK